MDEIQIVQAAQDGDLKAFNQLVLQYQDGLYQQAFWLVDDPDQAEDLVQDTIIHVYQRLQSFQGGSFRAWIMRILTNACLDELRRRKRHPKIGLEWEDQDGEIFDTPGWLVDDSLPVEAQIERAEDRLLILQALRSLPVEARSVLVLIDVLAYDYAEAAVALSLPLGTLKSRLVRARLKLRGSLTRLMEHQPGKGPEKAALPPHRNVKLVPGFSALGIE